MNKLLNDFLFDHVNRLKETSIFFSLKCSDFGDHNRVVILVTTIVTKMMRLSC